MELHTPTKMTDKSSRNYFNNLESQTYSNTEVKSYKI